MDRLVDGVRASFAYAEWEQGGPRAAALPADEQASWTGYSISLKQNAGINGSNAAVADFTCAERGVHKWSFDA